MKILARRDIRDLKPYEPGKPIKELERELGLKGSDIIKLASNENPIGPSPKAVKAILGSVSGINRYPEGSGFYLKKALAASLGLRPENVVLGNGSDELIEIITKAFMEKDEKAIISDPAFLEYKIIVKTNGAGLRVVPMKRSQLRRDGSMQRFSYDIDQILSSINNKTKLIFIGNPDNPTGAYLTKKELDCFLRRCPKDIIVVFDEAYRELVAKANYADPAAYLKRRNLIILRTFSKAYGLAGLRVGYAIANKELTEWMERVRQPFNVNMLAQVAAEAALSDRKHLARTRALVKEGRSYLAKELKRLGCNTIEGPANFMLFSVANRRGTEIFNSLLPKGLIIRDMRPYGMREWVRVNVGSMKENRRLIQVLKKIIL